MQLEAARAWSAWEGKTLSLLPDADRVRRFSEDHYALAFARIECHYFVNGGFFHADDQLIPIPKPHPPTVCNSMWALTDFTDLIAETTATLRERLHGLDGVTIEAKHASVAVHYRQAAPDTRARVDEIIHELRDRNSDRLTLVPGKMVYEFTPAIDWNKGKAVLHLIDVLGLDPDDIVPLYLGDDITDESAFRALRGRGIGILVGRPDDPEMAGRTTAADFVLDSVQDVEKFLTGLAR